MKENELWITPFAFTTDGRNLPPKQTKKVIVAECDRRGNCSRAYAFSKECSLLQDSDETKPVLIIERVGECAKSILLKKKQQGACESVCIIVYTARKGL